MPMMLDMPRTRPHRALPSVPTMATRSTSASRRRSARTSKGQPNRMATVQWLALGIVVVLAILAAFVFFSSGSTVLSQ